MIKILFKWLINVFIFLIVLFAGVSLVSSLNSSGSGGESRSILGLKFMIVLSDSMSPALRAGDLIICHDKKIDSIKVGDIITYSMDDFYVTHRVAEKISDGGRIFLKTRGDANNTIDPVTVGAGQLIGAFALRIPYGGYVINFFRSAAGLILILIAPASLFIYGEIKTILCAQKGEQGKEGGSKVAQNKRRPWLSLGIGNQIFNAFNKIRKNKEALK